MSGVIGICFSVEDQMKSRSEREKDMQQNVIDFEEFVSLKTSYETVVQENNDLLRLKTDYENVRYEKDQLQHENKEVKKIFNRIFDFFLPPFQLRYHSVSFQCICLQ